MDADAVAGGGAVATTATQERPPTPPPRRRVERFFRRKRLAHAAFLAALVAMFVAASTHSRMPFVVSALLYAVSAGWWVFEDQRSPSSGRRGRLWAVAALVAAGAALLSKALGYDDGVFLAVVLAYLGVGTLLTEARDSLFHGHGPAGAARPGWRGRLDRARSWLRRHLTSVGPVLLLACAALGAVGLALLGTAWSSRGAVLLLAAAVVAPAGIGLLSEDLLHRLATPPSAGGPSSRLHHAVVVGGLVLAAAVLAALVQRMEPETLVVAALVAGLLVLGLTSNTQTDVVLVVAVTATVLYLTADDVEDSRRHTLPGADPAVVVLGDSYVSGEGARAYFTGTDDSGRNECRRAKTSYAAVLAGSDPRVPRLAFLACSGAVAQNVHARAQYPDEPRRAVLPQDGEQGLDQLAHLAALRDRADFDVPFVLLSIGGNDSGFSTIGTTCLAPGNCSELRPMWTSALGHVRRQVGVAYDEVRRALPGVPVLVVPYPVPLSDRERCPSVWLDRSERDFLTAFVGDLNATLRAEAARAGFWYVEQMQESLAGQRLCDGRPRRMGINFIGLRSVSGLPTQSLDPSNWAHNSLHPNERGHAAMARTLARWLDAHPDLEAGPPTGPGRLLTPAEVASAARPDPGAPCDVVDRGPQGCRAVAERWALGEVRDASPYGLVPLAGLTGFWMASLGVLAHVRRRREER